MELVFETISDTECLRDFFCGIDEMDDFIHDGFDLSIKHHNCRAYVVTQKDKGDVVALFALSCDSLDLDRDDKEDLMAGYTSRTPLISNAYKDVFLSKSHYPALDIAYLAVRKDLRGKGLHIGSDIIEAIVEKAQSSSFPGCQFITVDALTISGYSSVSFYEKCFFTPCELPNPNKDTRRMYKTLYPDNSFIEE